MIFEERFDDEVELPAVYSTDDLLHDDNEFDLLPVQVQVQLPEIVKTFIANFYRAFADSNTWELHSIYENSFNKLSEKLFQKHSWPEPENIASLANNDPVFLILYRELYYRHIYAKLQPTFEDRIASYTNYCDLFNLILNSEEPINLELPNQWLWDIIDEFIYQFQSYCQYRSKTKSRSDSEIAEIRSRPDAWNVHNVLNVLYSLIQKSRINEQLWVSKNGGDMIEAAGEFGSRPLYRMLGYFSIVGLLRVQCLLGDYILALKTMENIELGKKGLFARVTACHVTTYYYIGFAYMMMRRYSDAVKAFAHILLFVSRTKQYHTRSYQYEVISKKCEQMYALLAICLALSPQRIDENVQSLLKDKYGEQLTKMQKGEEGLPIFEELFAFAAPKFISPVPPSIDQPHVAVTDTSKYQQQRFISEIQQQLMVTTIRSYMKLYTTLDVKKLGVFLGMSGEDLRTQLLVFKHKTRQRGWESGSVLEGEYEATADLNFYMKGEMIHIAETRIGRRMGEWFIRHINKFEELVSAMNK